MSHCTYGPFAERGGIVGRIRIIRVGHHQDILERWINAEWLDQLDVERVHAGLEPVAGDRHLTDGDISGLRVGQRSGRP